MVFDVARMHVLRADDWDISISQYPATHEARVFQRSILVLDNVVVRYCPFLLPMTSDNDERNKLIQYLS